MFYEVTALLIGVGLGAVGFGLLRSKESILIDRRIHDLEQNFFTHNHTMQSFHEELLAVRGWVEQTGKRIVSLPVRQAPTTDTLPSEVEAKIVPFNHV